MTIVVEFQGTSELNVDLDDDPIVAPARVMVISMLDEGPSGPQGPPGPPGPQGLPGNIAAIEYIDGGNF